MASANRQPKRGVLIAARLITAVVSLAGAEGVLWFGGYPNWWGLDPAWGSFSPEYEGDADLGWRARKGDFKIVWADGSDPDHPFHTTNWSNGRRATSEQESVPAGTRPLVQFFGDSFIQGYGLSDTDTLPWIVQKRHTELEVSNYGAGLYGTYQSYLAMKKWVHEPASVYYLFNSFHEDRNAAAPTFLRILKAPPQGFFYPYAELSSGEILGNRSDGELVWFLSRHLRTVALVQDYNLIFKSYFRLQNKRRVTEMLLAKMNEVTLAAGGKLTIILFDLEPDERSDYRRFLESQHIAFIDCDRPERNDLHLRLSDRQHPTGKLNGLIAEWIEPVLAAPAPVVSAQQPAVPGRVQ